MSAGEFITSDIDSRCNVKLERTTSKSWGDDLGASNIGGNPKNPGEASAARAGGISWGMGFTWIEALPYGKHWLGITEDCSTRNPLHERRIETIVK